MIREARCFRCSGKLNSGYSSACICYKCMCEKSEISEGESAPKLPDKHRIEQLQAELIETKEGLRQLILATRWIPVSERLPEKIGVSLILWHNTNDGVIQVRTRKEYTYDKNDTWGFTHWKPIILPEGE